MPACGGGCSGSSATSCGLTCSSSHTPGGQPQQAAAVGCSACHTPPSNASTALAGSTSSPGALTSSSLGHQRSDSSDGEFDPGLLEEGWQSDASSDNFLEIEEDSGGTEVVAVKEGVAVWPTKDARIMGRLSLVKQHNVLFLAWLPYATPAKPTTAAAGAAGRHSSAINSKGCVGGTGMGPAPQAPASQQQQYVGASSAAAAVAAGLGCGAAAAPGGCSNTSCGGPGAAGGGAEARDWLYKDAQGWQQPPAPSSSPRQAGGCASKATAAGGAAEAAACAPAACSCCWAGRGLPAGGSSCGCSCHSAGSRAAAEVGGGGWQQPTMAPGVRGNSSSSGGGSPTAAAAGVQGCGSSLPLAAATTAPGSSGSSGHVAVSHPGSEASMYAIHPFPLSDVIAITKHTPPLGWHHLVFVLVSGLTLPPLYFHQGGAQGLLKVLQQHVSLVPCARQPNTYLVNDTADPLRRSLTSLDLSDILLGAPQPGASLAAEPEEGPLAHGGWREPPPPVELAWRGLGQQLGETLSWVTSLARESASVLVSAAVDTWHADVLRPFDHDEDPEGASSGSSSGGSSPPAGLPGHWWGSQAGGQLPVLGTNTAVAAAAAAAGGRTSRRSLCDIQQQQQQQQGGCASSAAPACTNSTACITAAAAAAAAPLPIPQGARSSGSTTSAAAGTLWSDGVTPGNAGDGDPTPDTPLGSFEMVEGVGEEEGGLLARHHRARPPPLSREEFATYFTPEGVLADEAGFRERVYTSGMDPELRPEAWPLLLGVFPAGSTAAERAAAAEEQAGRYQALKAQWRSIGREQARKNRAFRERKGRVEKDVRRTDRWARDRVCQCVCVWVGWGIAWPCRPSQHAPASSTFVFLHLGIAAQFGLPLTLLYPSPHAVLPSAPLLLSVCMPQVPALLPWPRC